jgi:hypothetical protein
MRVEAERIFRRALTVAESNGDPVQQPKSRELGEIKTRRYLWSQSLAVHGKPDLRSIAAASCTTKFCRGNGDGDLRWSGDREYSCCCSATHEDPVPLR